MYGWLWKRIPGSIWIKCAIVSAGVLVLVVVLFLWVFPWLAPLLPFDQQTVGG
jgi:hypothetical protein